MSMRLTVNLSLQVETRIQEFRNYQSKTKLSSNHHIKRYFAKLLA